MQMVRHLRGVHGIEAGSTLVMTGRDEKRLSEETNESQLSTPASLVYESTPGSSSECTPAEYSYGTYREQKRSRDLDEDEDEEPRHQRTRSFDFSFQAFCADEEAEFTPYDEECGSFHTSGSQPIAGPPHSIGLADLAAEAFLFGPVTEHAALLSDNSEVALAETFHAYDQSTYFGGDMQLSAGVPPMLVSTGDGQVNFENSSMAQHHGYYAGPTYGEYSWNTASLDLSSFAE
ncbi:hypothetical protein DL96DRAFT_1739677 [Flagelloscypha sp. PMI_526]|nr:hypothetical protein DL96DRAFT_1739677 [Flagelloscypha sp. PMI_526]